MPHHLNRTELSWEEFRDNLCLRYRLMPQEIPATCDGCGKKSLIDNALSCPKSGLVLAQYDDVANEWGSLVYWALTPSAIYNEPKIFSRIVQGERTGSGAQKEEEIYKGGTDIFGEARGG